MFYNVENVGAIALSKNIKAERAEYINSLLPVLNPSDLLFEQ